MDLNADFSLPATPAIARRLVHIATICQVDLDDRIIEFARNDLISTDHMDDFIPLTDIRLAAAQFILDCNLRCGIPYLNASLDDYLVLDAIRLSGEQKITIATSNSSKWKDVLKGFQFKTQILTPRNAFEPEYQDGWRDGVMIMDWVSEYGDAVSSAIAREFPKTIIVGGMNNRRAFLSDFPWWEMGICLFPDMPKTLFTIISDAQFEREITASKVWHRKKQKDLAIFYNVFLPK